jgi:hypothetical protein
LELPAEDYFKNKKTNTNPTNGFILVQLQTGAYFPGNAFANGHPDRKNIYDSCFSYFSTAKIVDFS